MDLGAFWANVQELGVSSVSVPAMASMAGTSPSSKESSTASRPSVSSSPSAACGLPTPSAWPSGGCAIERFKGSRDVVEFFPPALVEFFPPTSKSRGKFSPSAFRSLMALEGRIAASVTIMVISTGWHLPCCLRAIRPVFGSSVNVCCGTRTLTRPRSSRARNIRRTVFRSRAISFDSVW